MLVATLHGQLVGAAKADRGLAQVRTELFFIRAQTGLLAAHTGIHSCNRMTSDTKDEAVQLSPSPVKFPQ